MTDTERAAVDRLMVINRALWDHAKELHALIESSRPIMEQNLALAKDIEALMDTLKARTTP